MQIILIGVHGRLLVSLSTHNVTLIPALEMDIENAWYLYDQQQFYDINFNHKIISIISINTGWATTRFRWHFGLVKQNGEWRWQDGSVMEYAMPWVSNVK